MRYVIRLLSGLFVKRRECLKPLNATSKECATTAYPSQNRQVSQTTSKLLRFLGLSASASLLGAVYRPLKRAMFCCGRDPRVTLASFAHPGLPYVAAPRLVDRGAVMGLSSRSLCFLPKIYSLLPSASCLLPSAFRLLPPAFCLLPTAYCLLTVLLHELRKLAQVEGWVAGEIVP